MPGREVACSHELLPHLLERTLLARQAALHAVPERGRYPVQVPDEAAHAVRHQRVRVVGALPGVVQREVLLERPRAEHVGDGRHGDAVVVVGEPDDELRVALPQRRDHREIEVLDLRRVRGRAVQHAELRVRGGDRVDGAVDVLERPAARREEHRLPERGDVAQERDVREVAGGELERVDAELREEVGARLVEGGGDEPQRPPRARSCRARTSRSSRARAPRGAPRTCAPKLFSLS